MTSGAAPTLRAGALTLRAPRPSDFSFYAEILASPRAVHMGGPFSEEDAWADFCAMTASWTLNGYGPFSIEADGEPFLGLAILHHERGDPEPELGCILTPAAEGRGIGFAAMSRLRRHIFEDLGWRDVVSYIAPDNARSRRLFERLGGRLDTETPRHPLYPECLIYRHVAPEIT